jgi:xanthosine utilization system XapX-like protein
MHLRIPPPIVALIGILLIFLSKGLYFNSLFTSVSSEYAIDSVFSYWFCDNSLSNKRI